MQTVLHTPADDLALLDAQRLLQDLRVAKVAQLRRQRPCAELAHEARYGRDVGRVEGARRRLLILPPLVEAARVRLKGGDVAHDRVIRRDARHVCPRLVVNGAHRVAHV